jgi:hypothetical protein
MKQHNVLRDVKRSGFVPRGSVTAKQNDVLRILRRQLLQKDVHAARVAIRHNQKAGFTGKGLDSAIDIPVFPDVMAWNRGTKASFAPTVFRLVDSAKAGLILKHEPYISFCGKL